MYISEFVCGVITTILVELGIAIIANMLNKHKDKKEE